MHHVCFILVCCIWGTSFLLMKEGLVVFSPLEVAVFRQSTGAAALGLLWLGQRRPWPFARRDLGPLLLLAVIGYAVPFCLQPYVIRTIDRHTAHGSAFTGMTVALVPLLTILVSVPMLQVWPSRRQLLGVVGGLAAMGVLFADELRGGVAVTDLLLASTTPLLYAVSNTFVRRRFRTVPTSALVLATLALSTFLLAPITLVQAPGPRGGSMALAALLMVVLGVVCTAFATYMFYKLVQHEGPLFAGMVTYIIPTVAMLLGFLRGERITSNQIAAMALVFVMVAITQSGGRSGRA